MSSLYARSSCTANNNYIYCRVVCGFVFDNNTRIWVVADTYTVLPEAPPSAVSWKNFYFRLTDTLLHQYIIVSNLIVVTLLISFLSKFFNALIYNIDWLLIGCILYIILHQLSLCLLCICQLPVAISFDLRFCVTVSINLSFDLPIPRKPLHSLEHRFCLGNFSFPILWIYGQFLY